MQQKNISVGVIISDFCGLKADHEKDCETNCTNSIPITPPPMPPALRKSVTSSLLIVVLHLPADLNWHWYLGWAAFSGCVFCLGSVPWRPGLSVAAQGYLKVGDTFLEGI